ncbi:MAG: 30S ribosome-binding factor RbfA [Ruminococcaceae bacterium]|nr:30S ribosome-binding factor RbfA [Oscillospiraceae bacterium]
MANHNIARLTEDVKREISTAMTQLKDKHIANGLVTVTDVEITNDLSYCKVYVSALGGGEKTEEAVNALQKAEGFFKKRINARIKMRKMPEITFVADKSLDYYEKINNIITKLPPMRSESEEEAENTDSETETD